ncbi:MAG: RHS repeat-associated core domain-containing protein [Candidatus Nitrotoga sp.]
MAAISAHAGMVTFDDLDASSGDIDLSGTTYQGFTWSNFYAYTLLAGFDGFNNGIVSADNAAYSGGENFGPTSAVPVIGTINSTSLFDFSSAYLNSAYYDKLDVTVNGLLNGTGLFSKTITISTSAAQLVNFSFTGINQLTFSASQTVNSSDPFGCGSFNCTQFTVDNLAFQDATTPVTPTVPEPSSLALMAFGILLFGKRRSQQLYRMLRERLSTMLVILMLGCFALPAQAKSDVPTEVAQTKLSKLAATQFEEPLIATSATTHEEDIALLAAIELYQHRSSDDDYHALTDFLIAHPESGWEAALLTNLGLSYYHAGRFSMAIDAWEKAWKSGKAVSETRGKALIDRALGELMRMHARIGHADRLEELFAEMGSRAVTGSATEAVAGAREGLWMMRHEPGISYLCGPMALKNLLLSQGASSKQVEFLSAYRSGIHGVSLSEVGRLAEQAKLSYTLIQRDRNEPIPVPSVVHWKVSHYAAIIGESQGRYHIRDPIFGEDLWVTRDAIDTEASGYFLVPTKQLQSGWREIQLAEADSLHGMGYTGSTTPANTTPQDDKTKPGDCNNGMCGYNFTEMVVSLNLNDTPVGYKPPKGPSVFTSLTYNQREASQPANFGFFNVSQKWSLNWLSYIQDSPTVAGAGVSRLVAGGGSVSYSGYNSGTGQFTPETRDQSVLVRTSANPIRYERRLPNGSVEVYAQSNGATIAPRRVFLSQLIDPAGNAVTLNYDVQLRLTSITDAIGQVTTFLYELNTQPLLLTKITDPFGRSASITYDANGRLNTITDVIGLTSSFHYNAASLIDSLTTPYGTSTFAFGESGTYRWLEATDPLGNKERLEYLQGASGIPFSDPAAMIPQGIIAPFNAYLNGRNTYYWDKHAYKLGAGNYTKARIKHWTHLATNTNFTTNPVESIKYPLENRIWFNYPGQPTGGLGTAVSGTMDKPNRIGRVLDDGTTQLTQISYNSLGNPVHVIDPLGRDTQIDYAANQIDVIRVSQKTAVSSYSTVAEYTYNSHHLPLTYKNAAGQTTIYSYNDAGQITQAKDALNQTSDYEYDTLGYLTKITNANGQTAVSLTYDSFGRVATRTDSEGHVLTYSYDNFDRITQTTYPDGTTQTASWDKLDLAAVTDRQGRQSQYVHDAVRNLVTTIDPLNREIHYGYYPNQTLKSLTDANGKITSWNRDLQSRVTAKIYDDGKQEAVAYESTTSRVKSLIDSLGQRKNYTYAKDNRPTKLDYLNALNATPSVSLSYDTWFPRVVSMTDGTGITQYQYQALGLPGALQLKQVDGPYQNDAIGYQYDALGRITTRTIDSSSETFSYDALNRTVSHNNPLGSFVQSYLGETSQLTGLQLSNGLLGTSWQYDDNFNDRRLLGIVNSGATRSYNYVITPENIINQIHETSPANSAWPAKVWDYGYDASDRLETVQASDGTQYDYYYDHGDNLTTITAPAITTNFTVNNLNQVAAANGQSYVYDANGNLVDDGVRTYLWDAENRLLQIGYKAQPTRSTQFRYDGLGRRIAIISKNGTIATENRYLWCGDSLCQSRTATDVVTRRYYPEGEVRPQGNALLYYNRDHLGSVRDVLAVQNGSRVAAFDYDAYGKPTQTSGRLSTDFRYAGMFYLQEAGLYLTQYRVYDPNNGRWLSRDPIGERGGVNLYGYVGGSPINNVDQIGLGATGAAIGGTIGGGIGIVVGGILGGAGGAAGGTLVAPGVGTIGGGGVGAIEGAVIGGAAGAGIGAAVGSAVEDLIDWAGTILNSSSYPPGFWPADKGAEEWGRRSGVGANEGRRRFHGVKQGCPGSKATDKYGVNPDTGEVVDPNGEIVGDLENAKPK